jgi:serine-type D-Ala-D-Ala carboxypeptidase/endopeptidase (penicillin-binding protein 4)
MIFKNTAMKQVLPIVFCLLSIVLSAQSVNQKLQKAFQQFEKDTQLKHAVTSLYVIDAQTGQIVFDKNSQIGLAPASTQKIITSVTAFELLGKEYRYKTELGIDWKDSFQTFICIKGSGDPVFGSNRFAETKPDKIMEIFYKKLINAGMKNFSNQFLIDNSNFETQTIPDGWIWQDLGNYYGAGAGRLNWKENQFDLILKSSEKIGGDVKIVSINGENNYQSSFINELKSAAKGSGDNAYIYLPLSNTNYIVRGTIPAGEQNFVISGATFEATPYFVTDFGMYVTNKVNRRSEWNQRQVYSYGKFSDSVKTVYTHFSPPLDSINYWFLKKSINLYGEALIKTLAYEKNGFGATDSGVVIIKNFWKAKGLDPDELNINDGSGLSPMNRVTAHAQVEILKYAKTKNWFPSFYNALPDYNGMKMKSGTIRDVKGFCGYHTSKAGKEYIFSFLVNNYNGKSGELVQKMYKVLDVLK